jgi:hypothetical protein
MCKKIVSGRNLSFLIVCYQADFLILCENIIFFLPLQLKNRINDEKEKYFR